MWKKKMASFVVAEMFGLASIVSGGVFFRFALFSFHDFKFTVHYFISFHHSNVIILTGPPWPCTVAGCKSKICAVHVVM